MADLIEITAEVAKTKIEYNFKSHSQTSKAFRAGPKYFTKVRGKDGWDTIDYYVD